jgi:hypothetical protein
LARRAKSFVLLGDEKELYHRSPSGILQRCISIVEGQELLQEIHSGVGMAILSVGSDIRGYPTRRVRFRIQYFTHGSYPYPTQANIGSGSDTVIYPRVSVDIRKYINRSQVTNCGPTAGPTFDRLG